MSKKNTSQYIPLYRKYRPQNLQEVVGQEHVKKALTNAINLNKISHAYLFTGPRGTGKTSIARILAKSLNCQQGPTITPCETCASCVDIKNSTPMDVIEIDAASNRSVEDARNILEKIQYVPTNGKFKIYIIDEVHMLTKEAFNTLLKTLEEPPENVIFILATTEPQKVLETITSRCQRFDFRRITTDDIVNHLKYVSKEEKINIEEDALFTIAKNAAGGMRDSLALLDQVSVLDSSTKITSEDVNKLLGRLSFDMLNSLSDTIVQSNPQGAIELLEKIYNAGNEPTQILVNLLAYFKNLLIVKNCSGEELLIDLTQLNSSQIKTLKTQAQNVDTHQIIFLVEKVVYYIKELKTTTNQHLWLEIAMIDLANLSNNTSLLALQERITNLENGISSVQAPAPQTFSAKPPVKNIAPTPKLTEQKTVEPVAPKTEDTKEYVPASTISQPAAPESKEELTPMPVSKPVSKESSELGKLWVDLLKNIASPPTAALLSQHTKPAEISNEKIEIICKENFFKLITNDAKKASIDDAAQKLFDKKVNVIIKSVSADEFTTSNPSVEKKNLIEGSKKASEANVLEPLSEPSLQSSNPPTFDEEISDEEDEYIEHELSKKKPNSVDTSMPSDQVSMVIKLFDGKYID